MRIFFDCSHTAIHAYKNTGIHRVVRELTAELVKIALENPDLDVIPVIFDGFNMHRVANFPRCNEKSTPEKKLFLDFIFKIKIKSFNFLFKLRNKIIDYILNIRLLDRQDNLILKMYYLNIDFERIKFGKDDIYIIADASWDAPRSYYHFLRNLKKHQVTVGIICYDLIPIEFPEYCSQKFHRKFVKFYDTYSVLFDKVLCISKSSAADYIKAQSAGIISKNHNSVVSNFRLGCNFENKDIANNDNGDFNVDRAILSERYILVVGSLTPHKNIKTIIAAFDLLLQDKHEDVLLVFAGNKGWDLETDRLIESHQMYKKSIHILGSVTDYELNILYDRCYCLVQASFYEGFGLPVVEALQHGKPVIASTGGSLPEVGGELCIYFNPTQPIELFAALKKLLSSDIGYNHLVERIRNEYKAFSWEQSAKQFLDCIYR
jgi:glycosyltransferase involved in cell wall biosynthesis